MSIVYIFAASKMECEPVLRLINGKAYDLVSPRIRAGSIGPNKVVIFRTGIGPKPARIWASAAFSDSDRPGLCRLPDAAIAIGLCGSLSRSLVEGDVVVYSHCLSSGGGQPQFCSPQLTDHLSRLLKAGGLSCTRVVGICTSKIVSAPGEKRMLAESGAEVVDMESYELVRASAEARVPVAVLRVISDSADLQMPDFNRALRADGDFSTLALARACISSPLATAKLFASSRRAIRKLSQALEVVLENEELIVQTTNECSS
jgi:nucleoside phosphorylase